MYRKFILLSLLLSLPIGAMHRPNQAVVKYAMTTHFYKKYIKGKTDKVVTLGMFTGVLEGAKQAAQDQGTINAVFHAGQVVAAVGTIGFIAAAPPVLVGVALASVASYLAYDTVTSPSVPATPIKPEPINTSFPTFTEEATLRRYESHTMSPMPPKSPHKEHHRHDPHPHFHPQEFEDDNRVKENYRKRVDGSFVVKDSAKEPFRTNDGTAVEILKIDGDNIVAYVNRNHVGRLDEVTGSVIQPIKPTGQTYRSKGNAKSAHTVKSEKARKEYYASDRVTQWEVSCSLPVQHTAIESPNELHGQASYDLHYSPNTTSVWSQTWKIGE